MATLPQPTRAEPAPYVPPGPPDNRPGRLIDPRECPDTVETKFIAANPKREGTLSNLRYEAYKDATTVKEFLDKGGWRADLVHDVNKNYAALGGAVPTFVPPPPRRRHNRSPPSMYKHDSDDDADREKKVEEENSEDDDFAPESPISDRNSVISEDSDDAPLTALIVRKPRTRGNCTMASMSRDALEAGAITTTLHQLLRKYSVNKHMLLCRSLGLGLAAGAVPGVFQDIKYVQKAHVTLLQRLPPASITDVNELWGKIWDALEQFSPEELIASRDFARAEENFKTSLSMSAMKNGCVPRHLSWLHRSRSAARAVDKLADFDAQHQVELMVQAHADSQKETCIISTGRFAHFKPVGHYLDGRDQSLRDRVQEMRDLAAARGREDMLYLEPDPLTPGGHKRLRLKAGPRLLRLVISAGADDCELAFFNTEAQSSRWGGIRTGGGSVALLASRSGDPLLTEKELHAASGDKRGTIVVTVREMPEHFRDGLNVSPFDALAAFDIRATPVRTLQRDGCDVLGAIEATLEFRTSWPAGFCTGFLEAELGSMCTWLESVQWGETDDFRYARMFGHGRQGSAVSFHAVNYSRPSTGPTELMIGRQAHLEKMGLNGLACFAQRLARPCNAAMEIIAYKTNNPKVHRDRLADLIFSSGPLVSAASKRGADIGPTFEREGLVTGTC